MHSVRYQTRAAPTWVGALMDPEFLRGAINDVVTTADAASSEELPLFHRMRSWPGTIARTLADLATRLVSGPPASLVATQAPIGAASKSAH